MIPGHAVLWIALATAIACAIPAPAEQTYQAQAGRATPAVKTAKQRQDRLRWSNEPRFGMFIHWLYSIC